MIVHSLFKVVFIVICLCVKIALLLVSNLTESFVKVTIELVFTMQRLRFVEQSTDLNTLDPH